MSIKVLIVEDDANWRVLYRLMLGSDKDIEIVAEFERAEKALEQIPYLYPDVAVVDLSLPGMTGLEFAEQLREYPAIKVIIVTAHDPAYLEGLRKQEIPMVDKACSEDLLPTIKTMYAKQA